MADAKYPPLLKNTPFVGSAFNRVVHRTDANCPYAQEISPNERWYIKNIPHDGNYLLCPFCFPPPEEEVEPLETADAKKDEKEKPAEAGEKNGFGLLTRFSRKSSSKDASKEDGSQKSTQTPSKPVAKKKPAAKKAAKISESPPQGATKKVAVKKTTAKKTEAKPPATKKAVKKSAAKKTVAKRAAPKATPAVKKAASKKATASKKSPVKKKAD